MHFSSVIYSWSTQTFLLYLVVIFSCYLSTILFKKYVLSINTNYKTKFPIGLLISGTILIFVKGFSTTGRDLRAGYYINFLSATSLKEFYDWTIEIGYRILNVLIRNITQHYSFFIFLIAFLTILPIIYVINKFQNIIDVPSAILLYTCIFFFSGFSPLRNYLASSIALLGFEALVRKKFLKALIYLIIAMTFHFSMVFLLVPYFFVAFKKSNNKFITICLSSFFSFFYFGRNIITTILSMTERYYIYGAMDSVHIGLEQIVYYSPLFVVYFLTKKYDINRTFSKASFSYLATGFCYGMVGYIIPIFGRVQAIFLPIVIIVPYYIRLFNIKHPKYKRLINTLVLIYCIARFVIYITQYYVLEDLMPYTTFGGWII